MRQISSWGLSLLLVCALEGNAHAAETPSAGAVGLGLSIGGGATAIVGGTVLLAT
jgi:hypothetical protein